MRSNCMVQFVSQVRPESREVASSQTRPVIERVWHLRSGAPAPSTNDREHRPSVIKNIRARGPSSPPMGPRQGVPLALSLTTASSQRATRALWIATSVLVASPATWLIVSAHVHLGPPVDILGAILLFNAIAAIGTIAAAGAIGSISIAVMALALLHSPFVAMSLWLPDSQPWSVLLCFGIFPGLTVLGLVSFFREANKSLVLGAVLLPLVCLLAVAVFWAKFG